MEGVATAQRSARAPPYLLLALPAASAYWVCVPWIPFRSAAAQGWGTRDLDEGLACT